MILCQLSSSLYLSFWSRSCLKLVKFLAPEVSTVYIYIFSPESVLIDLGACLVWYGTVSYNRSYSSFT